MIRKWNEDCDRLLRANKDMATNAIAKMIGVSPHTVRRHRERLLVRRDPAMLALYGSRNQPSNSQTTALRYAPDGWNITSGHPCLVCESYPPNLDTRISPCTRCDARVEWCRYSSAV